MALELGRVREQLSQWSSPAGTWLPLQGRLTRITSPILHSPARTVEGGGGRSECHPRTRHLPPKIRRPRIAASPSVNLPQGGYHHLPLHLPWGGLAPLSPKLLSTSRH